MRVNTLAVSGFRNLSSQEIDLSYGVNILCGNNAQGKTNFLEAIYFLAMGRSVRSDNNRELINFGQDTAHIKADIQRDNICFTVRARLQLINNKSTKSLFVDGIPVKNTRELFGRVLVVLFSPEDLRLVKAGPEHRRKFIDMELCQISKVYYVNLREYYKALKQRNHLLKAIKNNKGDTGSIFIWDNQLVLSGVRIMKERESFVDKMSKIACKIHHNITSGEELSLVYKPSIKNPDDYMEIMEKSQKRDITMGSTSFGVHKDDVHFYVGGISARRFGSQGQQRTAALCAKLAEIEIIRQTTNTTPILLLDDVLSELDARRQSCLLSQITDMQTIITCTGIEDVISKSMRDYMVMNVDGGSISK